MRPGSIAIVVSIALHGGVIAWVAARGEEKREEPPVVAVEGAVGGGEAAGAIAVVVIEGEGVGVGGAAKREREQEPATGNGQPATGNGERRRSGSGRRSGGERAPAASGNGKGSMAMRGGRKGDPGAEYRKPDNSWLDHVLDMPPGKPLEEPLPPSGELKQHGREFVSVEHPNPDDETFRAHVAKDGTVKLENRPDVSIHWNWRMPLVIWGKLAVDDAIMRKKGFDPYASAKLRFLDRTREERAAIGNEHRKQLLEKSAQLMRDNLARLWRDTPDPRARKELVFALWDECAETGDPATIAGGIAARTYLVGFVRAYLPAGSAGGFTPDELAALNVHKQSKATFAPYE